jgi:hypothetical protein
MTLCLCFEHVEFVSSRNRFALGPRCDTVGGAILKTTGRKHRQESLSTWLFSDDLLAENLGSYSVDGLNNQTPVPNTV